ncbi:MAG: hypothetical protein FWC43_11920 [Planctomycetaceae bacterium]|nr:hypothetical protein [Planctomycetaceae bacterium]
MLPPLSHKASDFPKEFTDFSRREKLAQRWRSQSRLDVSPKAARGRNVGQNRATWRQK